jgi:hypothetical protein
MYLIFEQNSTLDFLYLLSILVFSKQRWPGLAGKIPSYVSVFFSILKSMNFVYRQNTMKDKTSRILFIFLIISYTFINL